MTAVAVPFFSAATHFSAGQDTPQAFLEHDAARVDALRRGRCGHPRQDRTTEFAELLSAAA